MRVWVDLTNTAHPVILRPLVDELERRGHEVAITARPLSQTLELLADWGHPHAVLGHHGGASYAGKARAAAGRVGALLRWARGRGFDAALAHGSTDLPVACRALGIANTTMFDYEWASLQHHVNCRLATRVLVPDAIAPERLAAYGATRGGKLVRYPGLKEEYYLRDFTPDPAVLAAAGVPAGEDRVLVVVRTPPDYALYLRGRARTLLDALLARLVAREDVVTVVVARTPAQRDALAPLRSPRLLVPERALDARSLIALSDVLISAGGTMNREAAVLGVPVWTTFQGRMGAVDQALIADGRLRELSDPDQVELQRLPERAWERRVRRDPAALLELALDGV